MCPDDDAAVVLEPDTIIYYSHRGALQVFDDRDRTWMTSHHFVLRDGRQATYIETWWSEGAPDSEAVCLSPFPPKGLERVRDDGVIARA